MLGSKDNNKYSIGFMIGKLSIFMIWRATSKKLLRFEIMIPKSRARLSDKFQHSFNAVDSAVTGIDYTDLLDTV